MKKLKLIRKIKLIGKDKSRAGFSLEKILQIFRLLIPKYSYAILKIKNFHELDIEKLNKENHLQIKGIIIDSDETISYDRGPILKENIEYLYKLEKQGIKLAIFSNMLNSNRYDILPKSTKVIINVKGKPDIEGFEKSAKLLNLKKSELIMVGDNFFTDAGSIKAGIKFVKVKPIKTKHQKMIIKIIRIPEKFLRFYGNAISNIYDKILKRK